MLFFPLCAGHEALGDLYWAPSADGTSRARRGTAGKSNEPSPTLWLHLGVATNRTGSDAVLGCWGFFIINFLSIQLRQIHVVLFISVGKLACQKYHLKEKKSCCRLKSERG